MLNPKRASKKLQKIYIHEGACATTAVFHVSAAPPHPTHALRSITSSLTHSQTPRTTITDNVDQDFYATKNQIDGALTLLTFKDAQIEQLQNTLTTHRTIEHIVEAQAQLDALASPSGIEEQSGGGSWTPMQVQALLQSVGTLGDEGLIPPEFLALTQLKQKLESYRDINLKLEQDARSLDRPSLEALVNERSKLKKDFVEAYDKTALASDSGFVADLSSMQGIRRTICVYQGRGSMHTSVRLVMPLSPTPPFCDLRIRASHHRATQCRRSRTSSHVQASSQLQLRFPSRRHPGHDDDARSRRRTRKRYSNH